MMNRRPDNKAPCVAWGLFGGAKRGETRSRVHQYFTAYAPMISSASLTQLPHCKRPHLRITVAHVHRN